MIGTVRTMSTQDALVSQRRVAADLSQRVSQAGTEAATGMKSDIYRSLGLRASEALTLRAGMERNESFISSNQMLASRLDFTSLTLRQTRESAQSFLELAVSNSEAPTQTAGELQRAAQAALDRVIDGMNATFRGVPLFAGTNSASAPLQQWDAPHPVSGLSPRDVLADTIGAGIGDAADAADKVASLTDIFGNAYSDAPVRFEASFFNGTSRQDTDENPAPRVTARLDERTVLPHGIQANDPAFTDLLRGLSMIAATDPTAITDPEGYRVWVSSAVKAVSTGINGMIETESRLGGHQQTVDHTLKMQREREVLFNSQILSLEGVDPYEAATRLTNLQTQLEATYAVTSRLSKLSFLNFM